jgi:Uma2 family endonuclease
MSVRAVTKLVTAEELATLGDDAPFELIRGELRSVSPTKGWHGIVTGNFVIEFGNYGRMIEPGRVFTGEAGFFAEENPDTVIAPDVMFIRANRVPSQQDLEQGYVRVPPDAAVEVLSPSNRRAQVEEKIRIYLGSGVRMVIVANSQRKTIAVHTPDGQVRVLGIDDELDGGDVLPGFRVPVAKFFT